MWFKQFIKRNFFFLYPFLGIVAVGGVLLYIYSKEDLLLAVNSRNSPGGDAFFKYFTHVGDGNLYLAIGVLVLLFVSKYKAMVMILSYAVSSLPVQIIKNFAFEQNFRPRAHFWSDYHRLHFTDGVEILVSNSFPSGHTAAAFSLFLVLSHFCKNRVLSLVFFCIAFMVGYSRLYLAQHFFADAYAGSIFGVVCTTMVIYFLENKFALEQKDSLRKGFFFKNLKEAAIS